MILEVVKYGHPALLKVGKPILAITPAIKDLIANMFETMYDARGIGLAAQQVGEALQVTVIDIREASAERPSTLELNGKSADAQELMPLVLINPQITPAGVPVSGPEGCLSFPEIFADITRPEIIDVSALDAKGKRIEFRCGGLLARAIQHETDHLNGILFIQRMDFATKQEMQPQLDELKAATKKAMQKAKVSSR